MESSKNSTYSYRYVIAAACFAVQAIGIGAYVSYGVFFHPLNAEFGWSRATISGASSTAFFLMGLLGIFVGRLNDRIGPRVTTAVTAFFFGLGYFLMSGLHAVWQLYLFYGAVIGIGLSAVDVIPMTTTARWFIHNRGTMTGIVKVGTGAGQFIIPFAVSMLIAGHGWRTAFIILSASVSSLLFFIALLLRRDPGRPGPGPDGKKTAWRDKQDSAGQGLSIRETIRTRQFGTVCIVNLNTVFCLMIIMVHIVPHARDFGASGAVGAGVLATIGGVSMAGRFITGIAVDRMGSRKAMIVCLHLLIGALLWLQVADELWMLYLFAVVYGMAHGGFFTAISPLVAEFFGITAHGLLFGIVSFSGNVGGAAGPILAGYIFDVTAGYQAVFWLCTLLSGLGLVLIWSLKPIR